MQAIENEEELHTKAIQFIEQLNKVIFHDLPDVISRLINQEVWKVRPSAYSNFGEYALHQAPHGLGITNNEMLSLLKSAMNKTTQHVPHWATVLDEVENNVRTYAKEKKIPINNFSNDLTHFVAVSPEFSQEEVITYIPSRSKSQDGQLLKLKKKDPHAYDEVIKGRLNLNEAWKKTPRKKLLAIESLKSRFATLSKSERVEFLAWIEEEKESLLS